MHVCLNCNYKSETPSKFCPECGQPMAIVQWQKPETVAPPPEQPGVYHPTPAYRPPYAPPTYYYPTPVRREPEVSLGKKIAGMALGIAGLVFSLLAMFLLMITGSYAYSRGGIGVMIVMYAFIGLPLSIVGVSLSAAGGADGKKPGFSIAGKITGVIGIVLSAIVILSVLSSV